MTLFGTTANYDVLYATPDDLAAYTGEAAPANAAQLLRSVSRQVRRATMGAYYLADDTGLPTDPAVLKAFKDATCVQAAAWDRLGIDPLTGGVVTTKTATSKTLDGAAVTYADAQTAAEARAAAIRDLVPEACDILGALGLLQTRLWVYG